MSGKDAGPDSIVGMIGRINIEIQAIVETLRPIVRQNGMEIGKLQIRDHFNFISAMTDNTALPYTLASFRLNSRMGESFSATVQKRGGASPYIIGIYGSDADWIEISPSDVRDAKLWQISGPKGKRNIPMVEFLNELQQSLPVRISSADRAMMMGQIRSPKAARL